MSGLKRLSSSFSSQSFSGVGTRVTKKQKISQKEHDQQVRRGRKPDYKRIDGDDEEEVDNHLCGRCRLIDFEAIFDIPPDERLTDYGINVCDLGKVNAPSKAAPCELCSLFWTICNRNQVYEPPWEGYWHLRAFTTATLRNRSHAMAARAQELSIVVTLCRNQELVLTEEDRLECIDRGVILQWHDIGDSSTNQVNLCHAIPCSRSMRFDRVKDMLLSCDADHLKCKERLEKADSFPIAARVIDCNAREVVLLRPEHTYLALSYVWGPQSVQDPSSKNEQTSKLAERLPATIEDAILFTKALGMQYLWVDRMCVDQTQSEDTRLQISQMGIIYSNAYATICALGDHDETGIPGISIKRKRQLRVETQDIILSWTGPSLRRNVDSSRWRSRGWTYQESVLSRRCLFFTDHFVALACDGETSTENVAFNYFHTWSFNKESEIYGDAISRSRVLHPAEEFDKHIQEFQKRQLSYVADTLNAFKGILSQLSVRSYWGIPIYQVVSNEKTKVPDLCGREEETGFVAGLCWKVEKSCHTSAPDRENLPSWSWAGQKYARVFTNCLARSHRLQVAQIHFCHFQAMVRIKCTDETFVSLKQLCEPKNMQQIIPEQSRYLEIRSVMIRWQRQTKPVRPRSQPNWIKDGLDAYQVGENGWWKSDYVGNLYLDPSYEELAKPHDKCGERNEICRHITLKTGSAVLLALRIQTAGSHTLTRAVWLVVQQVRGGSYRRKGIIVSNQSIKSRSPIARPTEDMLETILLG